jgi:hypothetical protein
MSHWVLDVVMHRADMAILPGNLGDLPRLGLGLWRYPSASAVVELALVVWGGAVYWRAARQVAGDNASLVRRSNLCGVLAIGAGIVTLGLNVLGL